MMKQRVNLIDGLRGFSLLGILMANMLIFQYGMFGKDHIDFSTGDQIAYIWMKIFVESSFLPIFIFLFGYGLVKFKEKLEGSGGKVKRHLVRRSLLLLLVGGLHATFIWEGDILLSYGLIGFIMLIFLNRKKKTIMVWAILIFSLTSAMGFGEWEVTDEEIQAMDSYIEKEAAIYANGSYEEVFDFRNSDETPFDYPDYFYLILMIMAPLIMIPLFLFGMYAAKSNWFVNPRKERNMYKKLSIIFGLTGVLLKSTNYFITDQAYWTEGAYMIGAPFLSIGYIFGFALLYTTIHGKLLTYFELVGKLSMTNYLMQSVICTTIFYGYGFGLFGNLGVFSGIILAIVIFIIQIITSHFYYKIFRVGPMERIMRMGTYLTWNGRPRTKKAKNIRVA